MRQRSRAVLEPRKSPVQARSAASVDAILEATIQVLLSSGKEKLTTTRVASRAGVSIGTLYQYFPNKSALLQAALSRHLSEIVDKVELVCRERAGGTHRQMLEGLVTAFVQAKIEDKQTSLALHSVVADVDGAKVVQEMGVRFNRAVVRMLASSCEPLPTDPALAAFMLQGAITGAVRSLLESGASDEQFHLVQRELITLGCAYLRSV